MRSTITYKDLLMVNIIDDGGPNYNILEGDEEISPTECTNPTNLRLYFISVGEIKDTSTRSNFRMGKTATEAELERSKENSKRRLFASETIPRRFSREKRS